MAVSPADPGIPLAHADTVITSNSVVTIGGTGFNVPLVNLFTASGLIGPLSPLPDERGLSASRGVIPPRFAPARKDGHGLSEAHATNLPR